MDELAVFQVDNWHKCFEKAEQKMALQQLETGQLLYYPQLKFNLTAEEKSLFVEDVLDKGAKNISFNFKTRQLKGINSSQRSKEILLSLLLRFSQTADYFMNRLFPDYSCHLTLGEASYRPAQIKERKTSLRKNDRWLHVDAFPSRPSHGKRILRLFCNINPYGEERIWHIGECFVNIAPRYLAKIVSPLPGSRSFLYWFGITKSLRSLYDHFMLRIHDAMKRDIEYQTQGVYRKFGFPAGSSWIAPTDQRAHAAISGQYMLEQTFYLPTCAMQEVKLAPLTILEACLGYRLV
jgi:3-deoxy-D-manno-oct-2-ulosonic acid (Kdo) hydroxylase